MFNKHIYFGLITLKPSIWKYYISWLQEAWLLTNVLFNQKLRCLFNQAITLRYFASAGSRINNKIIGKVKFFIKIIWDFFHNIADKEKSYNIDPKPGGWYPLVANGITITNWFISKARFSLRIAMSTTAELFCHRWWRDLLKFTILMGEVQFPAQNYLGIISK